MSYWQFYNESLIKLVRLMTEHNSRNEFNYIEESFYPQVRDITGVVLSLIIANKKNSFVNVLDYGSNAAVWANFQNKFDTSSLEVTIYDPFAHETRKIDLPKYRKIVQSPNLDEINLQTYDLVIYGSVAQYDPEFISNWALKRFINSTYVLFTHTPLSLTKPASSKQFSGFEGIQTLHAFSDLVETLEGESFSLIFKSVLPTKYASVEPELIPNTVYANLLFKFSKNESVEHG